MFTLFYIILGWKEYNKPFRKAEQPPKLADSAKKPDLIPQKKDTIPTQVKDSNKPDPQRSFPTPQPTEPSLFNNKTPETPKIPETKPSFPTPKTPDVPKIPETKQIFPTPKTPEVPKMPDPPKVAPKTPETPKVPEFLKTVPKTPDTFKTSDVPKIPPRTPETPKMPDFKLAPEIPKKPETPKTPEPPKVTPGISKFSDNFKPEPPKPSPKTPEGSPTTIPSRRPESVMPDFPPSTRNPAYVPPPHQSEFPIPPYLPGGPQSKPLSSDDELFAMGNTFNNPKPLSNLRDLSYAKGEFPGEELSAKVEENLSRTPRYKEKPVVSNPDSLESSSSSSHFEEDEDF